jgi:hypothetical protein
LLPSDCYIRNKIGCHCINECEYEKDLKWTFLIFLLK